MTNATTENFWLAWSEPVPEPKEIFYRLYYNNEGRPICYSMEDLPGNYVTVDRETYLVGSFDVKVIDQKIVQIPRISKISKLKPNTATGTACHPGDICVVVDQNMPNTKWSTQ